MKTNGASTAPGSQAQTCDTGSAPPAASPLPGQACGPVSAWAPAPVASGCDAGRQNHRILIVDDNPAIHDDFRKVLRGDLRPDSELLEAEEALFGDGIIPAARAEFELASAYQGLEAFDKTCQAVRESKPYAMAFVDVRMPPGWDGVQTVKRLWEVDPELQIVICTAYSDYSWDDMLQQLGFSDNLVILKKPFDNVEVLQLAHAFTRKWELKRQANLRLDELTGLVAARTAELESANADLKREMQERLLAEKQLRHAQKMEAVGQLAAGVAHDFNNILTVIHGHASMLKMRLGEQGAHSKSISEIVGSAERAAGLVRQLLAFSRKQLLLFRNVEITEVIRSVSSMLRQLVGEHITLETECPEGLPPILADRGMIEQVIVNLTVNARDAMPRGGRVVVGAELRTLEEADTGCHPEARPGRFVCLGVSDSGCGMDANTLSHLFEPFFTTKEVGKGTGLGLATVYGIVKQHRGWIEVKSQVNAGTTFRIYFPAATAAPSRPAQNQPEPRPESGTETILVAEDENALRDMVVEALTLRGYRVLAAASGPVALQVLRQSPAPVSLLLTDMVMPGGMSGTELAAELRRANPQLKVIFTTGYSPGTAGLQASIHESGLFLPKPYSADKLAQLVRSCLDA